jgi:DNA-binding XRE family transcriptional regulator
MIGGRKKKDSVKRSRYMFVKDIRKRFDETQPVFAKRFGITKQQLLNYEKGYCEPCFRLQYIFDYLRENEDITRIGAVRKVE